MRYFLFLIIIFMLFLSVFALAQSPPFETVTITGIASTEFDKVSLFEGGDSNEPFKTEYISDYDGEYSIDVDIPDDMKGKNNYLYTDMRFWEDTNENGTKDKGEPISECHFIIWIPSAGIIYMQRYKGAKYIFESSVLDYNYDKYF